MPDIINFPNGGFEVIVFKRQDILDCIDDNIIDKEVALALIESCEVDIAECLNNEKWTGIPYIGNVRVNPLTKKLQSEEIKSKIEDAKNVLDRNEYIIFRKQLSIDISQRIKRNKTINYMTSIAVKKYKRYYNLLCKYGDNKRAEFICYSLMFLRPFNSDKDE